MDLTLKDEFGDSVEFLSEDGFVYIDVAGQDTVIQMDREMAKKLRDYLNMFIGPEICAPVRAEQPFEEKWDNPNFAPGVWREYTEKELLTFAYLHLKKATMRTSSDMRHYDISNASFYLEAYAEKQKEG